MSAAAPEAKISRDFRAVVDETTFDFRRIGDDVVAVHLDDFAQALDAVGRGRFAVSEEFWGTECRDGVLVTEFLRSPAIDRDVRVQLRTQLDRCPVWDIGLPGIPASVSIDGRAESIAFSVSYALHHVANAFGVCCLVFGTDTALRGPLPVEGEGTHAQVVFVAQADDLLDFWRSLYSLEHLSELEFFTLAQDAFPGVVCVPNLRLGHFNGPDDEIRPWVVKVLSILSDHFAAACRQHKGDKRLIQDQIQAHGILLSPDSSNTHANSHAMRQRDVTYQGETYKCEWHAKRLKGRPDRIHFSLPDQRIGGKLLIGIFTEHLD